MSLLLNLTSQFYTTLGSRGYLFLIDTDRLRRNRVNEAQSVSNRKHGLFPIRCFENGPLEPG